MSVRLEARGLSRRYGAVQALAGVDLEVGSGEVVGLLGPNGAGKSTAFRILAGLERPDRGTVRLEGEDVTRWPLHRRARRGLGYLPQHPSLFPRLTAAENVAVALRSVGRPVSLALELLEDADLGALAGRLAENLSGGERRRVEVARCLALDPRVVLLDEPFAGVDPAHVEVLRREVRRMAERGVGVLLTDHQVREMLGACDRAALLDGGAVLCAGSPREVAADPLARERYLGHGFRVDAAEAPLQHPISPLS